MKVRLLIALIVAVVGAVLIPGSAVASRPTEEVYDPEGDQFVCDGTLLTVQGGTVLERQHVYELGSGLSHVVVIESADDVGLKDEEGTEYRLVGTARGNFITAGDPDDDLGFQQGFFAFKLNFIGEGGLFGNVDFRLRRKKNGEEVVRDRGSCHFA